MPWVLWDIVVPLIFTFAIGLVTGWLLWRWRRVQVPVPEASVSVEAADVDTGLSANSATALIEERDLALERAERAELKLSQLSDNAGEKTAEEGSSAEDIAVDILLDESDGHTGSSVADDELDEHLAALEEALHRERASKAELEQAFMDLNNRCASLSRRLDDANGQTGTVSTKEMEELQRKYESSLRQVEESNDKLESSQKKVKKYDAKLESMVKKHQSEVTSIQKELSDKKSQIDQLVQVRGDLLNKLKYLEAMQSDSQNNTDGDQRILPDEQLNSANDDAVEDSLTLEVTVSDVHVDSTPTEIDETSGPGTDSENNNRRQSSQSEAGSMDAKDIPAFEIIDEAGDAEKMERPMETKSTDRGDVIAREQKKSAATEKSSKTTANGYQPVAWVVPERTPGKSQRDNLQQIKGVGPVLEKTLHKTGIYYFEQLAQLDSEGVAELDSQLPQFSGRIQRDKWVAQAKALYEEKQGVKQLG